MAARRVVRGECFDLHYCRAGEDGYTRLGLMVPKRLARAASLRNAIKRQGREAFRLMSVDIPSGDLVLRLTRPVKGVVAGDSVQRKRWRAEMENLLARFSMLPQ
jgi:ribonuclease P protein component